MKILSKPPITCSVCYCKFEYDASDVKTYDEQYWSGFFNGNGLGGWKWRTKRYVKCPGCGKQIILN